jgi:hypothetical protein
MLRRQKSAYYRSALIYFQSTFTKQKNRSLSTTAFAKNKKARV